MDVAGEVSLHDEPAKTEKALEPASDCWTLRNWHGCPALPESTTVVTEQVSCPRSW